MVVVLDVVVLIVVIVVCAVKQAVVFEFIVFQYCTRTYISVCCMQGNRAHVGCSSRVHEVVLLYYRDGSRPA